MQLVALVAFAVDVIGKAHAERLRALRPRFGIVAVENQHVAAPALRLLEEPAGCRSRSGRRDHLEEAIGANGKEGVLQPVFRNAAVAVAFLDTEQGPDQCRGGLQVRRDQADLAQAQIGPASQRPAKTGLRLATNAAAASLWSAVEAH